MPDKAFPGGGRWQIPTQWYLTDEGTRYQPLLVRGSCFVSPHQSASADSFPSRGSLCRAVLPIPFLQAGGNYFAFQLIRASFALPPDTTASASMPLRGHRLKGKPLSARRKVEGNGAPHPTEPAARPPSPRGGRLCLLPVLFSHFSMEDSTEGRINLNETCQESWTGERVKN